MEAIPDPVDEAQEILDRVSLDVAAEVTKAHAEMTLLAAVGQKANIVADFMEKAAHQGDEYVTGVVVAAGLIARNWCRLVADDADLELTEYISEEAEAMCRLEFAHYLAREILGIKSVPDADKLRREMADWLKNFGPDNFASVCMHTLGIHAELVRDVLDIKNGDYPPGTGDDR